MFSENNTILNCARFASKIVVAVFLTSSILIVAASTAGAVTGSRTARKIQKYPSEITIAETRADVFAGATKISFDSSREFNIVGFRVWRDAAGKRELVGNDWVAGSLMTVASGLLSAGAQYVVYDHQAPTNANYWVESVDINATSKWFGPIYPQISFDAVLNETESLKIANLAAAQSDARAQYDFVPFYTPAVKRRTATRSQSVPTALFSTDPNALKIEVSSRGLARISTETLQSNGFTQTDGANWHLYAGGVEQPMIVNQDGSVEFVGQTLDTVQTGSNTYWLVSDTLPGRRIERLPLAFDPQSQEGNMRVVAERRDRIIRINSILNGTRENWYNSVVNTSVSNQTLNLSEIAVESGQTATVGIDIQGLTAVVHNVSVKLNGTAIGNIAFNGYNRVEWTATVPLSSLNEGANTITLQSIAGSTDVNVTEAVRINYPRRLRAQNNRLEFTLPAGASPTKVKGFSTNQVRLFDTTDPNAVSEFAPAMVAETDGTFTLSVGTSQSPRLMLAIGEGLQPHSPFPIVRNRASNLRNEENSARFVIIAPVDLQPGLRNLVLTREAQGIETMVVDIEDIYDEFNDGVPSAEAIKSFLQFSRSNWSGRPEYVMLVGDASVDPRNFTGLAGPAVNRIPTFLTDTWNMETVSDEMLVDFTGDSVGEMAIGRLPVKTLAEVEAVTEKIVSAAPMSRSEIAERGVAFVSDAPVGYDFAAGSRNIAGMVPSGINVQFLDYNGGDVPTMRNSILARLNSGPALVNYFGHGSIGIWSGSQILRYSDLPVLFTPKKSTFIASITCLNGDFAEAENSSLAELFLRQDRGGAYGVWAASGWNGAYDQEWYARDFYRFIFLGMPVGDAARESKLLFPITDLRRTYILFGDPTQPLAIP